MKQFKYIILALFTVGATLQAGAQALRTELAHFRASDPVTIVFTPSQATSSDAGLVGAEKIYFHSGVAPAIDDNNWSNVVGNWGEDDGIGEMTNNGDGTWSLTIIPEDYYGTPDIEFIGGVFRDAEGVNSGRNPDNGGGDFYIALSTYTGGLVVKTEPSNFCEEDLITIFYDANVSPGQDGTPGNLVGAEKVYIHSGAGPTGAGFTTVIGNWGLDDGLGEMKNLGGDIWGISLTPVDYYGVTGTQELGMVFRDATGSTDGRGSDGGDVFVPVSPCTDGSVSRPVTLLPETDAGASDLITITYDSKVPVDGVTPLLLENDVYIQMTAFTSDGDTFTFGASGQDDNVGRMTPLGDRVYRITFQPAQYFPIAGDQTIDRIEYSFREAGPCDPCTTATDIGGLNYQLTVCN